MISLAGKVALVTGGSRGFGVGIAQRLVEQQVQTFITGRDATTLQAAAARIGATPIVADATSAEDWDRVFAQVLAVTDRLDILVNNAGAGVKIGPLVEQSDDDLRASLEVNLLGPMLGCRRAAIVMKRQRSGTIINLSSVCARVAWPEWSVYSAGKAGLVQFGKCLYAELRSSGVRVTTVMPSWGATDFTSEAGLGPRDPQTADRCIQPLDLGDLVVSICQLPEHLALQDLTLWPLVQELGSL